MTLALVASRYGTRVKEQSDALGNGGLGGGAVDVDAGAGPGSGAGSGGTTPGGAATGPMFGTLPVPCGPNTTGKDLTETGVGVTDSEIHVATISDPGGAKPGLDQSLFDSMVAFAKWCNGFGGING